MERFSGLACDVGILVDSKCIRSRLDQHRTPLDDHTAHLTIHSTSTAPFYGLSDTNRTTSKFQNHLRNAETHRKDDTTHSPTYLSG